ncbi:GGDEF domain-containing protein [Roseateles sp. BYS180W]|uniref:diguanylate cyclase n=1 Tax=Roseateles rivi TaxID=3299028 RepID=A0ABW7FZF5_9BURK
MTYEHTIAQTAQYLREALPLMSRQQAGLHPWSYAIWYEHVAGCNSALSRDLAEHTRDGARLDEAATQKLYRKHIAELDVDQSQRLHDGLVQTLETLGEGSQCATTEASQFERSLGRWQQELTQAAPGEHAKVLSAMEQGAKAMQHSMQALSHKLAHCRQTLAALHDEVNRARADTLQDALTGLLNRRGFEQALGQCLASNPIGTPVSPCLLLGNLDEFESLREHLGAAGLSDLISMLGNALRQVAQSHHVTARLNDHEFALLMPEAGLHEANMVAEQLRMSAASLAPANMGWSLSIGVTQAGISDNPAALLMRANQALLASRRQGRNRVTVLAADDAAA